MQWGRQVSGLGTVDLKNLLRFHSSNLSHRYGLLEWKWKTLGLTDRYM